MGWVTELRHDLFFRTRFKLLISYLVTIAAILTIFNFGLKLTNTVYILPLTIAIVATVVGYFLSGITLKPIKTAMQTQKRFIADASHELRTPLSIMKTNSEVTLLEGEELNSQEAAQTIKSNLEEIDRMSNILQNLLNLSQIDSQVAEMPFSRVNLADVVLHSLHSVDKIANKKKIRLIVTKSESALIWGNVTALEEMSLNLLKNAVFYTPEEGQVTIMVKNNAPQDVELVVQDTGIGISAKDLPHIFEPFYKTDVSRLRKAGSGSSGLGLTIVREIVKKHRGLISIKSALGKGTTVTVSFPASPGLKMPERV